MNKITDLIKTNASTKDVIEKTNSYCPWLWNHLHVTTNGQVFPCCLGGGEASPIGNINNESFDDIWTGPEFKKLRKAVLQDKKIPHCKTCYTKEQQSGFSLRHDAITKFHESAKDMVMTTQDDGTSPDAKPVYLDIRFSNICNMRCKMCGHYSSSKWFGDSEKLKEKGIYNYGTNSDTAIIKGIEDSDALLDRLEEYLPHMQEIYFAGGEPLFMEQHYKLLNKLIELKLTDIHIRYNSNLSIVKFKKTKIVDLWKHFSNVYCAGSIDTYGTRAENLRKDTVWSEIETHMALIHSETPHVIVGISPTIQILNAHSVCELNRQWVEKGWVRPDEMFWNILIDPKFYNVQNFPDHMKQEVAEIWLDHLNWLGVRPHKTVYKTIHTAIKWMNSVPCNENRLREMCYHTKILDQLRGEDTRCTFPELKYIWENYWPPRSEELRSSVLAQICKFFSLGPLR
tara:strand:+ start:1284 stop:2648 length:1365 start_codon:yes stop_codon:yes gene_type:complete